MFLLYVYTFSICSCHVVLKVYLLTYLLTYFRPIYNVIFVCYFLLWLPYGVINYSTTADIIIPSVCLSVCVSFSVCVCMCVLARLQRLVDAGDAVILLDAMLRLWIGTLYHRDGQSMFADNSLHGVFKLTASATASTSSSHHTVWWNHYFLFTYQFYRFSKLEGIFCPGEFMSYGDIFYYLTGYSVHVRWRIGEDVGLAINRTSVQITP